MLNELFSIFIDMHQHIINEPTYLLLFYLIIIWISGAAAKRIGIPIMLGEMLAGLILGPPILNIIHINPHIEWLAELGVIFLLFFTGIDVNVHDLKKTSKSALIVAFGGTIVPFIAGYFITVYFGGNTMKGLFIGMAISVTSIATKSRILKEMGLLKTKAGHLMLNAALYDNIFSLMLFAAITSLARMGEINIQKIIILMVGVATFFSFSVWFGIKIFPKLEKQFSGKKGRGFTFCLAIALMYGFLAELASLHFVVGVFLAGIFIREEIMESRAVYKKMSDAMYLISYGFLGPIFFITLSFHVNLDILFSKLLYFLIVLAIGAILGKVLGSGLSARLTGFSNRDSLLIGFAMNGRGMMEIVLVIVGIEMGILDNNIVSILVFIALISTLMTPLALKLIVGHKKHNQLSNKGD